MIMLKLAKKSKRLYTAMIEKLTEMFIELLLVRKLKQLLFHLNQYGLVRPIIRKMTGN